MRSQEYIFLLFHCLGELDVEDVVVLSPEQKYFLQRVQVERRKRSSEIVSSHMWRQSDSLVWSTCSIHVKKRTAISMKNLVKIKAIYLELFRCCTYTARTVFHQHFGWGIHLIYSTRKSSRELLGMLNFFIDGFGCFGHLVHHIWKAIYYGRRGGHPIGWEHWNPSPYRRRSWHSLPPKGEFPLMHLSSWLINCRIASTNISEIWICCSTTNRDFALFSTKNETNHMFLS
jgi:hypothetical protein